MGAQLGSDGGFSDLNLTPLIDIVLVVLINMMVNVPIQVEQMGVKLPAKIENPPPDKPPSDQLMVAMYSDGSMALNRMKMTEDRLFSELLRRLRPLDPKNVFIDAHPQANYGKVVDIMDMAREAGAEKVGLARLKEAGPPDPTGVAPGAAPRGLTMGAPTVVGAMKASIADVSLQPLKATIERCYTSRVPAGSDITGRLLARIAVGPQGEVMSHSITQTTLNNSDVEDCVDSVIAQAKFKPLGPQKTALIQVPYLFSPG